MWSGHGGALHDGLLRATVIWGVHAMLLFCRPWPVLPMVPYAGEPAEADVLHGNASTGYDEAVNGTGRSCNQRHKLLHAPLFLQGQDKTGVTTGAHRSYNRQSQMLRPVTILLEPEKE